MNCPHCRNEALIAVEFEEIEVDYCPECKGVWLDAGEIELMFADEQAAADFLSIGAPAIVPPGEKPRRCPKCHAKMTKESTSGGHVVTFDHCPKGHGLWFDAGELQTVLTESEALGGGNAVSGVLKGVFSNS